jgi:hypothetical protein
MSSFPTRNSGKGDRDLLGVVRRLIAALMSQRRNTTGVQLPLLGVDCDDWIAGEMVKRKPEVMRFDNVLTQHVAVERHRNHEGYNRDYDR